MIHGSHDPSEDQPSSSGEAQTVVKDLGASDGLHLYDDHPEIPVEPAGDEATPRTQSGTRELGERAHLGQRHRHLTQHAHDKQHQRAGDEVADDDRRPGGRDRRAAADE
jgi:hypothetical protein